MTQQKHSTPQRDNAAKAHVFYCIFHIRLNTPSLISATLFHFNFTRISDNHHLLNAWKNIDNYHGKYRKFTSQNIAFSQPKLQNNRKVPLIFN